MELSILKSLLISERIKLEEFICLCDTCPCFCAEDNFDGYLCEDCDPYVYSYDKEGDDDEHE